MHEERWTMKRPLALFVGALVTAGLAVTPTGPATAGGMTVEGFPYGATVTLNFPDLQWSDTTHCISGTVTGSFNGRLTSDWAFGADIQLKSDPRYSSYASYWSEDSGNFVAKDAFELCPKDHPNGVYEVRGHVGVSADPSGIWAWVEVPFATEFTLSPMPTATTIAPLPTVVGTLTTFSGRVTATTPAQVVIAPDPGGLVAIETLTGPTWTRIGIGNPDASGFFAIPVATVLPPGSQFRASYLGTTTCRESTSAVQVVPTPPVIQPMPTVKVKAISGRSKLKVDVNPNVGRKYWTFQVQRKNADGTWKALKTYRTLGSAEKRTLNLRKGTYKVFVNPKFGYQGAMSAEIRLKR
jgi:hypothetical protein